MIRALLRRLLLGRVDPVLQDRGQEFFGRNLDALIEDDLDRAVLSMMFTGAAMITSVGPPPEGQLLQDALAAGVVAGLGRDRVFLEIGGGPPVDHSNSASLDRLGWSGLVVEPNPAFADQYSELRSPRTHLQRVAVVGEPEGQRRMTLVTAGELSYVRDAVRPPNDVWAGKREAAVRAGQTVEVDVVSPSEIWQRCLDRVGVPSYVSIDVEGGEIEILARMPWHDARPVLVTAETSLEQPRIAAMDQLMEAFGYVRVMRGAAQWDNWYLDRKAASWVQQGRPEGSLER